MNRQRDRDRPTNIQTDREKEIHTERKKSKERNTDRKTENIVKPKAGDPSVAGVTPK